jgi:putative endonuclease
MPSMYILECADGSFYTGSAQNLARRFIQHMAGEAADHTKSRLPVKLVYCEYYHRIDHAFNREKQVQGWSREKKIALIEGRNFELPGLSINRKRRKKN